MQVNVSVWNRIKENHVWVSDVKMSWAKEDEYNNCVSGGFSGKNNAFYVPLNTVKFYINVR